MFIYYKNFIYKYYHFYFYIYKYTFYFSKNKKTHFFFEKKLKDFKKNSNIEGFLVL